MWFPLDSFQHFSALPAGATAIAPLRLYLRLPPPLTNDEAGRRLTAALGARVRLRALRDLGNPLLSDQDKADTARLFAVLSGISVRVLVLGSVSLAGILLTRADRRADEIAIRLALGIRPGQLIRLLLADAVLLGVVAAGGVVVVSQSCLGVLSSFSLPGDLTIARLGTSVDWRMATFACGFSIGMALLSSVVPILSYRRAERSSTVLRGVGRATTSRTVTGTRAALIVTHSAVSVVLLVGAFLMIRTVHRALTTDLGLAANEVVTLFVQPRLLQHTVGNGGLDRARRASDSRRLVAELESLPGVRHVTAGSSPFQKAWAPPSTHVTSDGGAVAANPVVYKVGPKYFETFGTPVLVGRDFTASDVTDETPPVAVVSQGTARLLWGSNTPVGRLISMAGGASVTVVGVVRDTSRTGIQGAPRPAVYLPGSLLTDRVGLGTAIRTAGRAETSLSAIRAAVTSVFPNPVQLVLGTAAADIREELAAQRFAASLFSWFGALALGLSALGLWGVASTAVLRRRRELAIRLALGAEETTVAWRTVAEAVVPVTLGSAIGLAIGALVSQGLAAAFPGVSRFDALSCLGAVGLLHGVACAAACAGTKGIWSTDPAVLLRES